MSIYSEPDIFVLEVVDPNDEEDTMDVDVEMTLGDAIRFEWHSMAIQRHRAEVS